jgi:5'-nucleotidase
MPGMNVRFAATAAALALTVAACSSSGSSATKKNATTTKPTSGSSTSAAVSTTTGPPAPLTILVTNDDGYSAPGIDTMVQSLVKLPGVTVTVVAPLANQSGTGSKTTAGALTATSVKTASGYPATAVKGYPADTIRYALSTVLHTPPDLVVSGINNGQNLGPFIAVSGTIGAAKAAAASGIPAIAVSAGLGNPPDYNAAATITDIWITSHRSAYTGTQHGAADVININIPTCLPKAARGLKQVPAATALSGRDVNKVNCASTATSPHDDIDAFIDGFDTVTELNTAGSTVTATTAFVG